MASMYYSRSIVLLFVMYSMVQSTPDSSVYTEKEKTLIRQLRGRVKKDLTQPIMFEDNYLIRYIRAQNHNLNDAERMIQRTLAWRREENMDKIFSEDFSKWITAYPFSLNIVDYQGKLVLATSLGAIDVRKLVLGGKQKEMDRYLTYGFERGLYNVQQGFNKTGTIDGYLLFNMAGYNARTHACLACLPSWLRLAVNYENHYPQLCTKIIVVNTPRIFDALLEIVKPALTSRTIQIIKLYDYNKAHWKRELFKTFPETSLTPEFGGTGPVIHAKSLHDQNYEQIINYNVGVINIRSFGK